MKQKSVNNKESTPRFILFTNNVLATFNRLRRNNFIRDNFSKYSTKAFLGLESLYTAIL